MNNNIKLADAINDSKLIDIKIVSSFIFKDKEYIIYSKNSDTEEIVYFARIINKDNKQYLINLNHNEERMIKEIINVLNKYDSGEKDA